MMKHTANHELSAYNGYGAAYRGNGKYTSVSVQCKRCNGQFEPDADWVTRYIAVQRKRLDDLKDKGYATPGQLLDIEHNISKSERRLLEYVKSLA